MNNCCSEKNQSCCCKSIKSARKVSTTLSPGDILGAWKVRWGINRMNYKVEPGLYSVGLPEASSPVLVTANYKLSFDALRKELNDVSAWILVLDTKGVNVWCAAGKGTFGTVELLEKINSTGISDIVNHRTLILPQLSAVGVSAHEVLKKSGFKVVYGPVRASDLSSFFDHGMKATKEMRKVRFNLWDRMVLTPVEVVGAVKPALLLFGIMFLLNQTGLFHFSITEVYSYFGAVLVGCVLVPILLPWIPFRAFSLKGWLLGMIWAGCIIALNGFFSEMKYEMIRCISYFLILPSVSAFYAMNFTGSSTYTSLSGVKKEMKAAIPFIVASIVLGIGLLIASNIVNN